MKASLILLALATGALAVPAQPPITAVPTAEQTKHRDRTAPTPGNVESTVTLHDGTHWTLVPSGAVVHLPAGLRSLVGAKAVGQLLTWAEFLEKNRSWITPAVVTFEEAAGTHTLPTKHIKLWSKQDKMIVAVHQGGPTSVRLPEDNRSLAQR